MAIKNFPSVSPDAGATFGLEANNTEFRSTLNGSVQHASLPGDRWVGSCGFSNRPSTEAQAIKAFLTSLGGSRGRFYLTPFDAYQYGTWGGSGTVSGAVALGASSMATTGWTINETDLAKAGDYIEVNGELKMITADASSDGSGNATLEFTPPLRAALSGAEAITTTNPRAVFYLDGNSNTWDINVFGVNTFAFSFVEDVS